MPREKRPKAKSMESLRHAEYYDRQRTFDELYARSQAGEIFDDLMDLILSRENIMLAYRNIKANSGSATPGTDRLRITDIGRLSADEVVARVRKIVNGGRNGYTPRSVRRKEIPKPNGKTRPLGIPCIWDRLIQQCIKQVMEPVCEAKFSSNSYGFRPNRSVENAIAAMYRLMQRSGLYYVVEFDIKGFFDNVDHTKLIRQLWSLNIEVYKFLGYNQHIPQKLYRIKQKFDRRRTHMSYFGSRFLLAKPAGCKVAGCAHPHPFAQVHRLMIEPDWLMKEPPAGSFLPSLPSKLRHRHPSSLTEVG